MFVTQTIIPIFLLILLGVAMRRWFGLREDFWPQLLAKRMGGDGDSR